MFFVFRKIPPNYKFKLTLMASGGLLCPLASITKPLKQSLLQGYLSVRPAGIEPATYPPQADCSVPLPQ
ncbi:hypothetical protein BMS3Bbin03_00476 [bacterium BMS3Bbin03]|nr:hypothetical protein BMS3Bbin03_00476 [bacterium BMS3Bbin03]